MPHSIDLLSRPGIGGVPMLRKDAEREIIRERMSLPENERQSEHQAAHPPRFQTRYSVL